MNENRGNNGNHSNKRTATMELLLKTSFLKPRRARETIRTQRASRRRKQKQNHMQKTLNNNQKQRKTHATLSVNTLEKKERKKKKPTIKIQKRNKTPGKKRQENAGNSEYSENAMRKHWQQIKQKESLEKKRNM